MSVTKRPNIGTEKEKDMSTINERVCLGVWLAFDQPDDDEASHEANIYADPDGGFISAWYNNAVGLVTERWHWTFLEACAYLEAGGYQDFTADEEVLQARERLGVLDVA